MPFDLLVKSPLKNYSLHDFTSDFLSLIRIEQWEHRSKGDNKEYYFRAVMMGVVITVREARDEQFKGYMFGIELESELAPKTERLSFEGLADSLARKFAVEGFDVVLPRSANGGHGEIFYFPNPDKNSRLWKPVLTEQTAETQAELERDLTAVS